MEIAGQRSRARLMAAPAPGGSGGATAAVDGVGGERQLVGSALSSGVVRLNEMQQKAVEVTIAAARAREGAPQLVLIHGPPGTGKTLTLVQCILRMLIDRPHSRILAAAPSNHAADLLIERLSRGWPVDLLGPLPSGRPHGLTCGADSPILRVNSLGRSPKDVDFEECQRFCHFGKAHNFELPPLQKLLQYRVLVSTCVASDLLVSMGVPAGHFDAVSTRPRTRAALVP